ncbi:hypothetical protein BJ741DRAFT_618173 [Chytriomyces cf. hyalinus JEL632]|nr:hypothetical protein BJ741DRAFT_618173 [Chytriomyces cf. hyalinus JEL632]
MSELRATELLMRLRSELQKQLRNRHGPATCRETEVDSPLHSPTDPILPTSPLSDVATSEERSAGKSPAVFTATSRKCIDRESHTTDASAGHAFSASKKPGPVSVQTTKLSDQAPSSLLPTAGHHYATYSVTPQEDNPLSPVEFSAPDDACSQSWEQLHHHPSPFAKKGITSISGGVSLPQITKRRIKLPKVKKIPNLRFNPRPESPPQLGQSTYLPNSLGRLSDLRAHELKSADPASSLRRLLMKISEDNSINQLTRSFTQLKAPDTTNAA